MNKHEYFYQLVKETHLPLSLELYEKVSHDEFMSSFVPGEILKKFPKREWYWPGFAFNPFVRNFDFVKENLELFPVEAKDFWYYFSWNEREVTLEKVSQNPQIPWNWEGLSKNTKVATLENILNNLNLPWNWKQISLIVSWVDVKNNLELPWDWNTLSYNNKVNIGFMIGPDLPWKVRGISHNEKAFTLKYVKDNLHLDWDFNTFALSMEIATLDFILENWKWNWNWNAVSQRKDVTIDFVKNNPHLPWDSFGLSQNPDICKFKLFLWDSFDFSSSVDNWEIIINNLVFIFADGKGWDWIQIQQNSKVVTPEIVKKYKFPGKGGRWNYKALSLNSNFHRKEIIEQNIAEKWSWNYLSLYGEIFDWDFIMKYHDKDWDWGDMGGNLCQYSYTIVAKRWMSAWKIQRWWRRIKT